MMMLDQLKIAVSTTIMRRATTLSTLPRPSQAGLSDPAPWGPITTAALVGTLGIDRGNWATWICRGVGPTPMPAQWFRPAPGRPRLYRVDIVLGWLAARHGEGTETVDIWKAWLTAHVGVAVDAPDDAVRGWAYRLAKNTGPVAAGFTNTGFDLYLDSLTRSDFQ